MAMFVVSPADSEPLPAGGAWGGNHKICTTRKRLKNRSF